MDAEIREFARGDDAAYEDWVPQHGGYVLVQRKSDDFMPHEASCGHLDLTPGFALPRRPPTLGEGWGVSRDGEGMLCSTVRSHAWRWNVERSRSPSLWI